jgi:hypothetical protein
MAGKNLYGAFPDFHKGIQHLVDQRKAGGVEKVLRGSL